MGRDERLRFGRGLPREFARGVPIIGDRTNGGPHETGTEIAQALQLVVHVLVTCSECVGARPMLVSPPGVGVCSGCGRGFVVKKLELQTDVQTGAIRPYVEIVRLDRKAPGADEDAGAGGDRPAEPGA